VNRLSRPPDASATRAAENAAGSCIGRATPLPFRGGPGGAIEQRRHDLIAVSDMGDLLCLDAGSGKVVWSKNFPRDYDTSVPMWGFAAHPLLDGDRLICIVGGKGSVAVAFDKDTGKEIWRALAARVSSQLGRQWRAECVCAKLTGRHAIHRVVMERMKCQLDVSGYHVQVKHAPMPFGVRSLGQSR
jgi:hypothetical protein